MQNCFIKLFKLQEFHVESSELQGKTMLITVRPKVRGVKCKDCGRYVKTVHRYLAPKKVKHMFWQGNLIVLLVKTRAFFCWWCRKKTGRHHITVDRLKSIPLNKQYSLMYAEQIMRGLGSTSFKTQQELAESSFSTVQQILNDKIDPFIGVWSEEAVTSLGLDCHSFSGQKMLPTITDISNHKLISILPDDRRTTVEKFLKEMPGVQKVTIKDVCIDMSRQYYQTIKRELPSAKIVVDAFHVVADANKRVSEVRSMLQKTDNIKLPRLLFDKPKEHLKPNDWVALNEINKAYPELFTLWGFKEEIRRIYKIPNSMLAKISFDSMIKRMKLSPYQSVRQWLKTLIRWQEEILAYFDNFTTNGYTEGVNTKLKTIKRLSYGFRNIDNYVRKAMLAFIPISLLLSHYLT